MVYIGDRQGGESRARKRSLNPSSSSQGWTACPPNSHHKHARFTNPSRDLVITCNIQCNLVINAYTHTTHTYTAQNKGIANKSGLVWPGVKYWANTYLRYGTAFVAQPFLNKWRDFKSQTPLISLSLSLDVHSIVSSTDDKESMDHTHCLGE